MKIIPYIVLFSISHHIYSVVCTSAKGKYHTRYYNQTIDHVNYFNPTTPKWIQRYLINDEHFGKKKELMSTCAGPILLYTGKPFLIY